VRKRRRPLRQQRRAYAQLGSYCELVLVRHVLDLDFETAVLRLPADHDMDKTADATVNITAIQNGLNQEMTMTMGSE
jgi:hypothetical protein